MTSFRLSFWGNGDPKKKHQKTLGWIKGNTMSEDTFKTLLDKTRTMGLKAHSLMSEVAAGPMDDHTAVENACYDQSERFDTNIQVAMDLKEAGKVEAAERRLQKAYNSLLVLSILAAKDLPEFDEPKRTV
jgi:hypothetical protein